MAPQEGRRFTQEERLIADLPTLVRKSVGGQRDRELLYRKLFHTPTYEPVVAAVAAIQELLLNVPLRDPQRFETIANFLGELIHATGPDETSKSLPVNDRTAQLALSLQQKDERLRANQLRYALLPGNYANTFPYLHASVEAYREESRARDPRGEKTILKIGFARRIQPGEDLEQRRASVEQWNVWMKQINDCLRNFETETVSEHHADLLDELVGLLRKEPEQTVFPQGAFFRAQFGTMALADIESFPHPLANEHLDHITAWIREVKTRSSYPLHKNIVEELFLDTIPFYDMLNGQIEYNNREFLKRIAAWQEHLVYRVMLRGTPLEETETAALLRTFSKREILGLTMLIYEWSTHPLEYDSEFQGYLSGYEFDRYPLFAQALRRYIGEHGNATFDEAYPDEIATTYFESVYVTRLRERFAHFGVDQDAIETAVHVALDLINRVPFEEQHMYMVREVFRKTAGEEFLNKLNERAQQLAHTTSLAWDSIPWRRNEETGVQYLPLQNGIEAVTFTPNSLPAILGLHTAEFRTVGSSQDWTIAVKFTIAGIPFALIGMLKQEGNVTWKAPIDKEIPGLHALLQHIAVVLFHDLVVQDQSGPQPKSFAEQLRKTKAQDGKPFPSLPRRTRTERQLIDTAYKVRQIPKTRQPAPVTIHKKRLQHAREYIDAIHAYRQTEQSGIREERRIALARLDQARELSYRFHMRKAYVPAKFQLQEVIDPITQQTKVVETWVIEHVNPKPKEDESLPEIFVRHYKDTSATASLEQLKPWLIGE